MRKSDADLRQFDVEGVVADLDRLRSELDVALGLVGKPTVDGIDGGVVQRLGGS